MAYLYHKMICWLSKIQMSLYVLSFYLLNLATLSISGDPTHRKILAFIWQNNVKLLRASLWEPPIPGYFVAWTQLRQNLMLRWKKKKEWRRHRSAWLTHQIKLLPHLLSAAPSFLDEVGALVVESERRDEKAGVFHFLMQLHFFLCMHQWCWSLKAQAGAPVTLWTGLCSGEGGLLTRFVG